MSNTVTANRFLGSGRVKLVCLTMGHFMVDMYGGFLDPLIPLLYKRLDVELPTMIAMVTLFRITVNAVQPVAGLALSRIPRRVFLIGGVGLAACTAFMGLPTGAWSFMILIIITRLGIGAFHPAALLATQSLSRSKEHLAVPVFISGGFFGWSMGAVVATQWVTRLGMESLWLMVLPGALIVFLVAATNPRVKPGHETREEPSDTDKDGPNFYLLMVLAISMVSSALLLYTFLNVDMKARFGDEGIRLGGIALGAVGLFGVLSSYLWGYMSKRASPFLLIACGQAMAAAIYPFMIRSTGWTLVFFGAAAGAGMAGGLFPLIVTISRRCPQLTRSLRAGLIIGGVWGTASLIPLGCGYLTRVGISAGRILMWVEVPILATIMIALSMYLRRRRRLAKIV